MAEPPRMPPRRDSSQSPSPYLPRPRLRVGRIALVFGLIATGLILLLTIGITREEQQAEPPPELPVPTLTPPPNAAAPRIGLAAPEDRPNMSDQAALDEWANRVAGTTKLDSRVLIAYGKAEMWMRSEKPDCRISWNTIAGIGRVESEHGNFAGAQIGLDGRVTTPIIGPPLDGTRFKAVPDTEGGRLDGDPAWDRAIGPMQFLPETWAKWGMRANSDGAPPDPQHIDDAALGTARYLCSSDADLTEPHGWWDAVLRYNQSVEYGQAVYSGAEAYAVAAPSV